MQCGWVLPQSDEVLTKHLTVLLRSELMPEEFSRLSRGHHLLCSSFVVICLRTCFFLCEGMWVGRDKGPFLSHDSDPTSSIHRLGVGGNRYLPARGGCIAPVHPLKVGHQSHACI